MSDITEGINCNIVSFADDTRLYSAINNVTDCDDLQADLENIYKWADTSVGSSDFRFRLSKNINSKFLPIINQYLLN